MGSYASKCNVVPGPRYGSGILEPRVFPEVPPSAPQLFIPQLRSQIPTVGYTRVSICPTDCSTILTDYSWMWHISTRHPSSFHPQLLHLYFLIIPHALSQSTASSQVGGGGGVDTSSLRLLRNRLELKSVRIMRSRENLGLQMKRP